MKKLTKTALTSTQSTERTTQLSDFARTNRFRQRIFSEIKAIHRGGGMIALLMVCLLAGCSRDEYKVALAPDEAINLHQEVLLDNHVVGNVAAISQEGATRIAVLRITNRAARNAMRIGVERERDGAIQLSSASVKPDAARLETGAVIPTRAPLNNATKKTLAGVENFLWSARDYATDHPVVGVVGLLIAAIIVFALVRGLFGRRACASLWLAAVLAAAATASAAEKGVIYTRDRLRDELSSAQRHLSESERNNDAAARFLDAELTSEAAEQLLCGLFKLDTADVGIDGFQDRVGNLKSSALSYSREDEQKRLTGIYTSLRGQLQSGFTRVAALRQRFTSTNLHATALTVYVAKRDLFRNRIRNEAIESTTVLEECRLTAASQDLQDEVNRLRRKQTPTNRPAVILATVTNEVRTVIEKPVTNTVVIYRTNSQTVTNYQKVVVDRPVTNTVMVQNSSAALVARPTSGPTGTLSAIPRIATAQSSNTTPTAGSVTNRTTNNIAAAAKPPVQIAQPVIPKPTGPNLMTRIGLGGAVAVAVIALLLFGLSGNARDCPAKVDLTEATSGDSHEVAVVGPTDVVVLEGAPHSAPNHLRGSSPVITRDRRGNAVLFAPEGTSVNGQPAARKCRLIPGDKVTLAESVGGSTWIFGGISPVESTVLEPQI